MIWSGTNSYATFLVGWEDSRNYATSQYDPYVRAVGANSDVLFLGTERPVATDAGSDSAPAFAMVPGSGLALAVYSDWTSADGYVLRYRPVIVSGLELGFNTDPATFGVGGEVGVGYAAGRYLAAFTDASDVYAQPFDLAMTPGGRSLVARGANKEQAPTVTFGGGYFLVAWEDYRNPGGSADIYAARVVASGYTPSLVDPSGLAIATGTSAQTSPVAAFGGNTFYVAWRDGVAGAAVGRPLSLGGGLGNPAVLRPGGASSVGTLAIDFDGSNFFVASGENTSAPWGWHVHGQRVSPGGALVGGVIDVASPEPLYGIGRIRTDALAGAHLVVWSGTSNLDDGDNVVRKALVSATGAVSQLDYVRPYDAAGDFYDV